MSKIDSRVGGLVSTADTTGTLQIQTNSVNAITIDGSQVVSANGGVVNIKGPAFNAYQTASTSLLNTITTLISLQATTFDTASNFNTSTSLIEYNFK